MNSLNRSCLGLWYIYRISIHFCDSEMEFCIAQNAKAQEKNRYMSECVCAFRAKDALNVNNKSPKWNNNMLSVQTLWQHKDSASAFSCNVRTVYSIKVSHIILPHFLFDFFLSFSHHTVTGNSETKKKKPFFHSHSKCRASSLLTKCNFSIFNASHNEFLLFACYDYLKNRRKKYEFIFFLLFMWCDCIFVTDTFLVF